MATRTERDSMGELEVPFDALYGAQTQRAINNFPVSHTPMPTAFIHAVTRIKLAAARANQTLGGLDSARGEAIQKAARDVLTGKHDQHFPIDVFQTGSGTSTNMNVNEVLATLASREGVEVTPNDHVNMGQSSNDVIPTAIHLSAAIAVHESLRPALVHLRDTIDQRASELSHVVKTGRTHLMDAMPLRMDQELGAWSSQINQAIERFDSAMKRLCRLAQGGTAVGTGVNAPAGFAEQVAQELSEQTGLMFTPNDSFFASLSSQDAAVELSGQLKGLACVIMKIANDLRWMNSGPLAGLGEIASNLLTSISLMSNTARLLADRAIATFKVREENLKGPLAKNPILVTALNGVIGYNAAAAIAKEAYQAGRAIIDVAEERTDLDRETLERLLDPTVLTQGGVPE